MYAKLIKHSISTFGKEIWTFELVYPRLIHAELMTHRLFSRNAASSRAIPIDKLIGLIESDLAYPSEWGLNEKGMQAKLLHKSASTCKWAWECAAKGAVISARILQKLGLHKQICNRVIEPYQNIKTIVTTTEIANWDWLRYHGDADPTIEELAKLMLEAREGSVPDILEVGEYHLPYVDTRWDIHGGVYYLVNDRVVSLYDAIKISTSCCAQVSYRLLDESIGKALMIYDALVTSEPVHASPFEHVATPMECPNWNCLGAEQKEYFHPNAMKNGEHMDNDGYFWSGNFKGWYQYRQEITNNVRRDND